jgi:hypothetical protein
VAQFEMLPFNFVVTAVVLHSVDSIYKQDELLSDRGGIIVCLR